MIRPLCFLVSVSTALAAIDTSGVTDFILAKTQEIQGPFLEAARAILSHPEISGSEVFAHDTLASLFEVLNGWNVTRSAWGEKTAFEASFVNLPNGVGEESLPVLGFVAEYDALNGVEHACGHHLIALNGILSAALAQAAVVKYNIPAKIRLLGCPDEEERGGKIRMWQRGAFTEGDVWMMAHPTVANAIQPMLARRTAFAKFTGSSHEQAVLRAYHALVSITDAATSLPGTASSIVPTEHIGRAVSNVVQTENKLGIRGSTVEAVNATVLAAYQAFQSNFAGVNWTTTTDSRGGVVVDALGPGGHAAEGTQFSALRLTIETFRSLANDDTISFYLPHNDTIAELDLFASIRTRYTPDLQAVVSRYVELVAPFVSSSTFDDVYPALEVTPNLTQRFINIMSQPKLNQSWGYSTRAPASTDLSQAQLPQIDPTTKAILSEAVPVLHANFGICPDPTGAGSLASTELAFENTMVVSRAIAELATLLAADNEAMAAVFQVSIAFILGR
ncbi:hypothetical protein BT69DRAFT_1313911 [Atractiella rhizophila]|nr:hypothetical protein BT69DRAFT_1313911 [Atractiella rhizophila]